MSTDNDEVRRLRGIIISAHDILFDEVASLDPEHYIQCHADTLPQIYRRLAATTSQALDILQAEISKMVGEDT